MLGVVGAGIADRLRVPGLLLFLALGMALGDDGLNWISLSDEQLAQGIAVAALVVILYEGGLSTDFREVRQVAIPAVSLATIGVVITAGVTAGAATILLEIDRTTALLIGAVVASTDAAAVFSVLRNVGLPRRLSHLLEAESGANDPMAVLLTAGLLATWEGHVGADDWVVFGVRQLGGGLLVGLAVGWLGAELLTRSHLTSSSLYPVLALGVGGLAYGGAAALAMSGLPRGVRGRHGRRRQGPVAPAGRAHLPRGVGVHGPDRVVPAARSARVPQSSRRGGGRRRSASRSSSVLVARPLAVLVSIGWMRFRLVDLVLVSWAGLRGAVPIVLATFPLTSGYPEGQLIFDVVFFVVVLSVLVQGLTVGPLARRLGMKAEPNVAASMAEALPVDAPGVELLEIEIGSACRVVGRPLAEVPPPLGARVSAVMRGGEVLIPTGSSTLQPGDRIVVFGEAHPDLARAVRDVGDLRRGAQLAGLRPSASRMKANTNASSFQAS